MDRKRHNTYILHYALSDVQAPLAELIPFP
jgi:hypothetical protein